jgi:D-tyrosyl-tRNA(Tyr) deacylase
MSIIKKMAEKVKNLRVFEDENQKMNLNLSKVNGKILAISQFTLYGDTKGNNRPSFIRAARPEHAKPLYDSFVELLKENFDVETGEFQKHMEISSINDGPLTIIIEMD